MRCAMRALFDGDSECGEGKRRPGASGGDQSEGQLAELCSTSARRGDHRGTSSPSWCRRVAAVTVVAVPALLKLTGYVAMA